MIITVVDCGGGYGDAVVIKQFKSVKEKKLKRNLFLRQRIKNRCKHIFFFLMK